MIGRYLLTAGVAAVLAMPAMAQDTAPSPAAAPVPVVAQAVGQPTTVLPANTELLLAMNETITTKGKRWSEGDTFDLTVTHDVLLGNYIVIPKGARGVGRISWMTNKGAFGKSGKMEIDLEYVDLSGRRIPIAGHYRQEGEGNTVATVGGVIAAGVFAGFVTGKSGTIPQGRELSARTKEDLPVALPAGASPLPVAVPAVAAQPTPAVPASTPAPAPTTTPSS